eukprot:5037766-Amphidinium_carterae.1
MQEKSTAEGVLQASVIMGQSCLNDHCVGLRYAFASASNPQHRALGTHPLGFCETGSVNSKDILPSERLERQE